jgi:protein-tyrosine kinase
MLRTQVTQTMDQHGWKILGLTSPTAGCGKTVTALNLAFSIARLENRSALLVDLDLRKPEISDYLGLRLTDRGLLDVLDNRISSRHATIQVRATATDQRIAVLPTASAKESAGLMGSQAMGSLLRELKRDAPIVILDLPPILSSDDVISILPQVDCVLLVAAAGRSNPSDILKSIRHLESTQVVRVVLNMATDEMADYYY